ncbi:MAG: ribonuclease P protein component [Candidatus Nealsonbacteria bacterium RBG_13_36_15]|uniref:Ribonuclease P protein component n=1 Tax=Candidatus Nealsonbacteria bacterium RBG_13_36_15 TaxID=1801660 RepID=A0A1G2DWA9_9BACT|nr:MAG: ribonuclease P protein component [Candidatus Nealsonbacteria bacterium RBG_13_36_15]
MLPAKNRLSKKKDFQRVFKKGRGTKEDLLIFKWAPNNLQVSRFGFAVSKKVSKKAVLRNKIKRKLREKIRKELPLLKKGIDGVVIVNPGAAKKGGQEMVGILNKIFSKTGLIKNNGKSSL